MKSYHVIALAILAMLLLALAWPQPAAAAGPIILDGQFGDWNGQPFIQDPQGDAGHSWNDLRAFYFATNPGESSAYFMAQRWDPGGKALELRLLIDTNNNGLYTDMGDRMLMIDYQVKGAGLIDEYLYSGTGAYIRAVVVNMPWGEIYPGGQVEWGISFSDLGIAPYQTIRMQLQSMQGNTPDDQVAEIQWSPAAALGYPLLAVLLGLGAVWLFYRRKKLL